MVSVLARVPKWFFSLDPLIAEAKRRMRRRRLFAAASIVALAAAGAGIFFAIHGGGSQPASRGGVTGIRLHGGKPPSAAPDHVVVNVFGQPSRPVEVAGRPLAKTLAVFRSSRLAAALPAPSGQMQPLASVAAQMSGDPGQLRLGETRRVATAVGPIYLVPTTHGWACVQGPRFETCQRGLLVQGITWHF